MSIYIQSIVLSLMPLHQTPQVKMIHDLLIMCFHPCLPGSRTLFCSWSSVATFFYYTSPSFHILCCIFPLAKISKYVIVFLLLLLLLCFLAAIFFSNTLTISLLINSISLSRISFDCWILLPPDCWILTPAHASALASACWVLTRWTLAAAFTPALTFNLWALAATLSSISSCFLQLKTSSWFSLVTISSFSALRNSLDWCLNYQSLSSYLFFS